LISDDPMSTLTNLSIALTKAGNDYAVHHLRVNYSSSTYRRICRTRWWKP